MKKFRIIFSIAVIFVILAVGFFLIGKDKKKDLKIGIVSDNEIEAVSISRERKMVNVLKVDGAMQFWIPKGLGWYKVSKIKKILDQEKKKEMISDIFFYNLGFIPDKILFLKDVNDWKKDYIFLSNFGFRNWFDFKFNQEEMIINEETLEGDYVDQNNSFLDETMMRDFADSNIVNDETRLTIVNTTAESGLANFIGNCLERAGFSVISTENSSDDVDGCLIRFGKKLEKNYVLNVLNKVLNCNKKEDKSLDDLEIELYLGSNFAKMLKYSNVRTF
jgi:hypothetical protein